MTLHELLNLDRTLLIFDTETTGQNPREDRIVSLGFIELKPDGSEREWESLVNPCMPIPKEATYGNPAKKYSGHGITDEMVQAANVPTFRELAPHLLKGFRPGVAYGGFNIRSYDLPIMRAEFERNGYTWSYEDALLVDGLRMWQLGMGRSLSDAVETFLGEKHEGAHGAIADVRASMRVMQAQLLRFANLPRDLVKLHDMQYPKDPNALTPDGKIIWKNGAATMNFGKNWSGKRLDMMARKDLTWIVSPACQGASREVKEICEQALQGKFPTQPIVKETPTND